MLLRKYTNSILRPGAAHQFDELLQRPAEAVVLPRYEQILLRRRCITSRRCDARLRRRLRVPVLTTRMAKLGCILATQCFLRAEVHPRRGRRASPKGERNP